MVKIKQVIKNHLNEQYLKQSLKSSWKITLIHII